MPQCLTNTCCLTGYKIARICISLQLRDKKKNLLSYLLLVNYVLLFHFFCCHWSTTKHVQEASSEQLAFMHRWGCQLPCLPLVCMWFCVCNLTKTEVPCVDSTPRGYDVIHSLHTSRTEKGWETRRGKQIVVSFQTLQEDPVLS